MDDLPIQDDVVIPASDLDWSASRSGGPGGQNVNKTSTKVDLRFDLAGTTALHPAVKARLRKQPGVLLDAEGQLVIMSSATRSQAANLEDARERLREKILAAMVRPKRRRATKPSRGAKRRRLKAKRMTSEKKQGRKKVDY
ncbi:MAG: aminoacyl-tRNA hydrolase [Deltaproteobacteria bacterium]|nr:aminoacyl-tRNA hydrolase [Deltaproteobacteria bacterium]